jgi:hypothetical protein
VSRLDFAPPLSEMQVDLEQGTLEFPARANTHIDQEKLKKAIEDAGYKVEGMEVSAAGSSEGKP